MTRRAQLSPQPDPARSAPGRAAAVGLPPGAQHRRLMALPAWDALDARVRDTMWRIDAAVAAAPRLPHAGLDRALPPPTCAVAGIHHRLTPLFPPVTEPIALDRSRFEAEVLARHHAALAPDAAAPLAPRLARLAAALAPEGSARTAACRTQPDHTGRYVVYPSHAVIPAQLDRLDALLRAGAGRPRAYGAIAALLAIMNCHPFTDGNGRTARAAFNRLLVDGEGAGGFYLPVKELELFSRGGYIVRVREVDLRGDWLPVTRYLLAAVRFWSGLLAAARP